MEKFIFIPSLLHYGIRRNITSHFNLELSFGYGISYSNSVITLEAMPSFRVGYVF